MHELSVESVTTVSGQTVRKMSSLATLTRTLSEHVQHSEGLRRQAQLIPAACESLHGIEAIAAEANDLGTRHICGQPAFGVTSEEIPQKSRESPKTPRARCHYFLTERAASSGGRSAPSGFLGRWLGCRMEDFDEEQTHRCTGRRGSDWRWSSDGHGRRCAGLERARASGHQRAEPVPASPIDRDRYRWRSSKRSTPLRATTSHILGPSPLRGSVGGRSGDRSRVPRAARARRRRARRRLHGRAGGHPGRPSEDRRHRRRLFSGAVDARLPNGRRRVSCGVLRSDLQRPRCLAAVCRMPGGERCSGRHPLPLAESPAVRHRQQQPVPIRPASAAPGRTVRGRLQRDNDVGETNSALRPWIAPTWRATSRRRRRSTRGARPRAR